MTRQDAAISFAAHQQGVDGLLHHPPAERGPCILGMNVHVAVIVADAGGQLFKGNVRELA